MARSAPSSAAGIPLAPRFLTSGKPRCLSRLAPGPPVAKGGLGAAVRHRLIPVVHLVWG